MFTKAPSTISKLIVLIGCLFPASVVGQISGAITSDTTWTAGTVIADSVYIPAGKTLTVQPGTIVKFNAGKMLVVAGKLVANGTSGSLITFTSNVGSPTPGSWKGIQFDATANVTSVVAFCVVEYAGASPNNASIFYNNSAPPITISNCTIRLGSGNGIDFKFADPRVTKSTIRQNAGYGIYGNFSLSFIVDSCTVSGNTLGGIFMGTNSTPSITYSAIDSNGTGIFISSSAVPIIQRNNIRRNNIGIQFTSVGSNQPTISLDTIANNTTWGMLNTSLTTTVVARRNYWGSDMGPYHVSINPTGTGDKVSDRVDFLPWISLAAAVPDTSVTANVTTSTTWANKVYWIKNSITVTSGDTLRILPGTVIKFASSARLTISGMIKAVGNSSSYVVFTSDRDDTHGGDTNGDSTATLPAPGNWDMLYLPSGQNSNSELNYCIFRFGGSSGNGNFYPYSCSPTVTNVTSTSSSNYGMYAYSCNTSFVNCSFGSNNSHGAFVEYGTMSFYNVQATNNGSYGIYVRYGATVTVRKSRMTGNSFGLVVDGGTSSYSTLTSLDSSVVSFNRNGGVYVFGGVGAQTFAYNRIEGNIKTDDYNGYGIWCTNQNATISFVGDTVLNNGGDGIITSKATLTNNVLQGNRYPIGYSGRVSSTFSGNTITGNQYNKAIALRIQVDVHSLSDTLTSVMPPGITSYVLADNYADLGVQSGKTLVIQPGVIIKSTYWQFRVDGTLIADGTSSNPIVFTSYRDSSYGGKTTLANDYNGPAPGNWRYVRIRTAGANGTVLNHVIIKYGGIDGYGNLWFEGNVVLANPVTNIISRRSSNIGIRVGDSQITFNGITVDSNGTYGMYVEGNRPSDVTIRNSIIQDNFSGQGLRAVNNSAFREVSNSTIRRNSSWGIGVDNGTIDQVFQANIISNNGEGGIWNISPSIIADNLQYIGNIVENNNGLGILSTRSRYISNTIRGNTFPLGVFRRTGNIYKDNNGVDENIITGNTYNNAIAIWDGSIQDTLKSSFPQAITSKTYVAIYDIDVPSGNTLVIEPGVKVKFQEYPTGNPQAFDVRGTLIANGTPTNPIIFTSWRDSTAGGKTTALTDYAPPVPGDWYYVAFRNGSGSSVVRHCQFKYGGRDGQQTVYFEQNLGGMKFANNLVRRSSTNGIFVYNTAVTIDSTTVDSCGYHGIRLVGNAANNLILKNSKILDNGRYGVWAESPGDISIISNCVISRNGYTGVYAESNSVPLTVIGNTVNNNADHGLYLVALNDASDSLLTIAGNRIRNNGDAGLFSSRAYISDDSITGNRYGIGLIGQLSLASTGTANGNVYQNNFVSGNTYHTMVTEGGIYGKMGYSWLPGDTNKVIAVRGDGSVPSSSTLTIAPGTVIKFPREYGNGRFQVDGILKSEGTTTNKVIFTSWKDDSYGGDSNLDTTATVPAPSDWDMVYLLGSSNNSSHIFNTIIRYGGRTGNGNLHLNGNSAPIDSSISSFSSNHGIFLYNASSTVTGCDIHHNPTGILLQASSNPVITQNNFFDNTTYGLNNNTNTNNLVATNNYWGASSGPYVTGSDPNLTGTGNRILFNPGTVTYRPWLTSRSGILVGDVSLNGSVTPFDASLVLRHVAGSLVPALTSTQLSAADVNGSGAVSALDASLILQYVVGIITGFPRLGKEALDPLMADGFDFKTRTSPSGDEMYVTLALKKSSPIFATEVQFKFDSTLLAPIDVRKFSHSERSALEHNFTSDGVGIALASIDPLAEESDVFELSLRIKDKARGAGRIAIDRFVLNEVNLTDEANRSKGLFEKVEEIPTSYALKQNYPNPFNPSTSIEYQLPATSAVTVKVFDVLGRELRSLVNSEQKAGFYRVVWDGRNSFGEIMASNVYYYRIEATSTEKQHFSQVKKMLLVK